MKQYLTLEEATNFFSEFFRGEHHIPNKIKEHGYGFEVNMYGGLSTFDFNNLTRLVFLAHDKCIRVEIKPSGFGMIKLCIWKRFGREGCISERHPTIETALEEYNKHKLN